MALAVVVPNGYGIACRIEQTSGGALLVNYGTLYPALLKLEQAGYIASEWGFPTTIAKPSTLV
jgi:DNA-binding PadR family transcriptional regulator